MFDRILVVYNEKQSEIHLNTVKRVKDILKNKLKAAIIVENLDKSYFKDIDLVITIGGDGTFTRTANYLNQEYILGINSEPEFSEGALLSINENELTFLEEVLKGEFKTISRQRAKTILNGQELKELALNEVYVGAASQFHSSRYIIKYKESQEEQRSSGVIISTGSGSHAWYKSAGGVPFAYDSKELRFIVREPYFGKKVFKPKILHGHIEEKEYLEFESKRTFGGIISIDMKSYEFNNDDCVRIELSDKPLQVIVK